MTATQPQTPASEYNANESESTNTMPNQTPPPVDRNWLKNLIIKHSDDPRYKKYSDLYHEKYPILKDKALVVAPMVDQSDLPFRLLCRKYGANLCFTPMIHAKMFTENPNYRIKFWNEVNGTPPEDRPLIVQLCGSNMDFLLFTIRHILKYAGSGIDGFDLNCGCPQNIAKKGQYGAFLLEKDNGDKIVDVVRTLVKEVGHLIPISVKVRILPSGLENSLKLYKRLVDAGASMLTVHGRTRMQKGLKTGKANWDAVKQTVDLLGDRVPILSNGSIGNFDDVRECLAYTGADGIMSSEAILEYAPIFTETGTSAVGGKRTGPGRIELAREFLEISDKYPPDNGGQGNGIKCVRAHIHRILHKDLGDRDDLREIVTYAKESGVLWKVCETIQGLQDAANHVVEDESLAWYMRHRVLTDQGVPLATARELQDREVKKAELCDDAADCFSNLFGGDDDDDF